MRSPRPVNSESGFLLTEVLLAMVIMGLVLAALTPLLLGSRKAAAMAELDLKFAIVVRKLTTEAGARDALRLGQTSGLIDGVNWRRTVTQSSKNNGTGWQAVNVSWDFAAAGLSRHVETLRLARLAP